MRIYKVMRAPEWEALQVVGETLGAPVDVDDGFVHFSTAAQLSGTLARHFRGETGLMLAAVDTEPLGVALRWEPGRDGERFPHLYRALRHDDVASVQRLEDGPGGPVLPPDLP